MKKGSVTLSAVVIAAAFVVFLPATGSAGVNVNITLPLPPLMLPAPPGLVVVPGTYVYYPPELDVDIFFYRGYWYRPNRGSWYIGSGYNGPWRTIGPRAVPGPLLGLPPSYRRLPARHEHVPYQVVERNWRTWERERYWDDRRHGHDRGQHRGWDGDEGGGHGHGRGHGRHGD